MSLGEAPGPVYYLTAGAQVTALCLHQLRLTAGLATGEIISYNCNTWREETRQQVFAGGGLLWLDVVDLDGVVTLVAQGRFDGVKLFHTGEGGEWSEVASFAISHTGFCPGYLHRLQSDLLMIVASGSSKVRPGCTSL